ncbi:DUF3459 domain-containing protein [Microbacterium sp. B2969]|uniref:DUF3459 domain-containing protein n=1 Tax=Microbacterium alkaliflavum TaxID=3248839 RepID=A0ABW7QAL7_9MICO
MTGMPFSSGCRSTSTAAMNWSRSTCSTHRRPPSLMRPVCGLRPGQIQAREQCAGLGQPPARTLLEVRRGLPAFSPFADQRVEQLDPRVFVVRRGAGTDEEVVAAINVSDEPVRLPMLAGTDVLSGREVDGLELAPFGYAWLVPASLPLPV